MNGWRYLALIVAVAGFSIDVPAAENLTSDQLQFFESKIRPVLIAECYGCHSDEGGNVRGGLRLDTKQFTLLGGSSGPAVVPGEPDESLMLSAIKHDDFVMPPKRKLSDAQIDDFRRWIEMGAPDPRESQVATVQSSITGDDIREARESFWAYRMPQPTSPPSVNDDLWPKTEIDRFILDKLQQSGLSIADDAEPDKIVRRLCFDLVGLPPTPEQVQSFRRQWEIDSDRAIGVFVDRLLESKQFGERWGRHWLDVVRYGESTGSQVNMTFPHAWRYRDFVIDSFNDDKPFDRFIQQQIAGDLIPAKSDEQWTENLIATTFLAIGPKNLNEQNRIQFAADLVDEQIDAVTRVFLGTSVACARCHDHKFDPIPQSDYYAMAGLFSNATTYFGNPPSEYGNFSEVQANRTSSLMVLPVDDPNPFDRQYASVELARLKTELSDKIREQRQSGPQGNANQASRIRLNNEIADLSAKVAVVDGAGRPRSYCMGVQEQSTPSDATFLVRGEIDLPGPKIPRGLPKVLTDSASPIANDSSGRLELARWIGSDQNSLTARVMVNRIWQHMLGRAIVTSTDNFGSTGQSPSHPELLDHLAVRFVESGWSVKDLIREIANSHVYRISSSFNDDNFQVDPDNALVWRANQRRLDAEAIRDAMLSASGQLKFERPRGSEVAKAGYVRVRGGFLGDPREAIQRMVSTAQARSRQPFRFGTRNRDSMMSDVYDRMSNALDMNDATYRSVYLPVVRDELPRSLDVFDFADPSAVIGTREESNTANQSLYMMNNPFVIAQSQAMARRIANAYERPTERIDAAFVLAFGRTPSHHERTAAAKFLSTFSIGAGQPEAFAVFCQSLFATAEFRYLD